MHVAASTDSTLCQGYHVPSDFIDYYRSSNCDQGTDDRLFANDPYLGFLPNGIYSQLWTKKEMMSNLKAENVEFYTDMAHLSSGMHSVTTGGISIQDSQFMLADSGHPLFFSGNVTFEDNASVLHSTHASYMSNEDQSLCVKAERDELITPYQNNFHNYEAEFNVGQDATQLPVVFPSMEYQSYGCFPCENNYTALTSDIASHYQDIVNGTASKLQGNMGNFNFKAVDPSLPHAQASIAGEKQFGCAKREGGAIMIQHNHIDSHHSKGGAGNFQVEDDSDVCIIEDISHPAPTSQSADIGNCLSISRCSRYVDSQHYMVGSTRLTACDERNILQVALQVGGFIWGFYPW